MELWAKHDEQPGNFHLLIHHLADVAGVSEALFSLPIWRARLARIAGRNDLSPVVVSRLCFFAALHDLGKCNAGFQRKIRGEKGQCGHVGPSLLLFDEEIVSRSFAALMLDRLSLWCGGEEPACRLLLATISHHGRPIRPPSGVDRRIWLEGYPEPLVALSQIVKEVSAWFPAAFEETSEILPSNPEFHHAFNGLVTLADWIGSDTRFFPYSAAPREERISFARGKAAEAVAAIGIDQTKARGIISSVRPDFHKTFGYRSPRSVQSAIVGMESPDGSRDQAIGSIAVLEAETGSGKTEAAFLHFQRLFLTGLVDGIYFALPTRAAATQIHGRIRDYASNTFGDETPPVVLGVPGYIKVDEGIGRKGVLPGFQVLWSDEDRFRYRGWAAEHSKRYLAGSIVVGTIDQVLLSALAVSHSQMRFSALTRLLLVVDEVHASDTYMGTILKEVLDRHTSAGGHALLLSATLGSAARTGYLLQPTAQAPTLDDAVVAPYPAIIVRRMGVEPEVQAIMPEGKDKAVTVELTSAAEEPEAVVDLGLNELRRGGRILILRNLVKDVIRTQEALESRAGDAEELFKCRGLPVPHHGRYAPEDRKILDAEIEKRFGKSGPAGPGLVIASRTVEQSLDIDFDLIITDLAPMDVLLQRIGRLHRHLRPRSADFEDPRIIILTPTERDLGTCIIAGGERRGEAWGDFGLGSVFDNLLIIEASLRLLEKHRVLRIPAMNRYLVEMATHPERMELLSKELGGLWLEHFNKVQGQGFARSGAARIALFDRSLPFGELGAADLDRSIATRLGENDRIVHFPEELISPFGSRLKSLRIPGWLVSGCSDDELMPVIISVSPGQIGFSCCGKNFIYDKLGLRPVNV